MILVLKIFVNRAIRSRLVSKRQIFTICIGNFMKFCGNLMIFFLSGNLQNVVQFYVSRKSLFLSYKKFFLNEKKYTNISHFEPGSKTARRRNFWPIIVRFRGLICTRQNIRNNFFQRRFFFGRGR